MWERNIMYNHRQKINVEMSVTLAQQYYAFTIENGKLTLLAD